MSEQGDDGQQLQSAFRGLRSCYLQLLYYLLNVYTAGSSILREGSTDNARTRGLLGFRVGSKSRNVNLNAHDRMQPKSQIPSSAQVAAVSQDKLSAVTGLTLGAISTQSAIYEVISQTANNTFPAHKCIRALMRQHTNTPPPRRTMTP